MAAGFPTKANWATGDVLTAAQMDDLAGTVNLLAPTAKGSIKVGTAANTVTDLAVGANDYILTADSTTASGVRWAAPSSGSSFVGCAVYMSGDVSISGDTDTIVNFNSEFFDTNGFHDNSTNNSRITIPSGKAGKYLIIASYLRQTGQTYSILGLRKNGTRISVVSMMDGGAITQNGFTLSRIEDLSVGDYLQIYVQFGQTKDLYGGQGTTTLAVYYLGA